jgi:ABC-type glutathione transport system ATPase component
MSANDYLLRAENIGKYFNLTKSFVSKFFFGDKVLKAVDHVTFQIKKGKTLGLVGESGCGKSTIARVVTRLIEPSFGKVTFKGQEIFSLKWKEMQQMRRNMQIIFQDPFTSLNPRKKIETIIGMPLEVHYGIRGQGHGVAENGGDGGRAYRSLPS